jgi:type IV pilus assembly protein PilM
LKLFSGAALFAFSFFQNKQFLPMLGLDLSATSARLVELSMRKGGCLVLERCAMLRLENAQPAQAIADNFDQTVVDVRRLIKKSRTKTKNVAMALPPTAVMTKIISLPKGSSESAFEVQVEQEATRFVPYPLDEANLDYRVIGPSLAAPHLLDVHVAVSRREKVQDFSALAEAAGLNLVILDVSSYASRAAMKRLVDDQFGLASLKLVALVELGAHTTSVRVMRNDVVLYDRDQPFGGVQLTQLISERYHLSFEEAETQKRSSDLPQGYEAMVLAPFVDQLAAEINRALAFFFANTAFRTIDALMLAGGSASLPGLRSSVEAATLCPCFLVNPFEGMQMSESVRLRNAKLQAPAFLTACGLALRRFSQ